MNKNKMAASSLDKIYCIKNLDLIDDLKTNDEKLKEVANKIRDIFEDVKYVVYGKKWVDISDEDVVFRNYLENSAIFEMIRHIMKTRIQKNFEEIRIYIGELVSIANLISSDKLKEVVLEWFMEKYDDHGLLEDDLIGLFVCPCNFLMVDWSGVYEKILQFHIEDGFYD